MRFKITAPRVLAAFALLPAGLLAAGCGIQSTDVIAVGDPATAQAVPPPDEGTVLYFVGPDGLMPVVRSGTPQPALPLLFAGPDADERAAGIRSELPPLGGPSRLGVNESGIMVVLDQDVSKLTLVARRQIACTALRAVARGRDMSVTIRGAGAGTALAPVNCTT
ncbi:hypothetical protein [Streptomyces sp. NBC_00083]|uniref:hypothetical protein n=1 Tax=Streptomyces sp. NBC_00083 TaxID=2975647 RepID=UPI0022571DDD|nr:hypothetical protein [Streptomyces sp. NBC_00083]MCX5386505.1 hypothetical protein [Streptomyces sp. NBC_00083]